MSKPSEVQMTVCDLCGQLSMVTIGAYCFECRKEIEESRQPDEQDDDMPSWELHNEGLCNPHQCTYCEDEE